MLIFPDLRSDLANLGVSTNRSECVAGAGRKAEGNKLESPMRFIRWRIWRCTLPRNEIELKILAFVGSTNLTSAFKCSEIFLPNFSLNFFGSGFINFSYDNCFIAAVGYVYAFPLNYFHLR